MERGRRSTWRRALIAVLLVVSIVWGQGLGSGASLPPKGPASPPDPSGQPLASQGAYQLGKVRILGVPVITVASPVLSGEGKGPDATTRAQVIEGNLEMLYRGRSLCSSGEALAEALVHHVLAKSHQEGACALANATLLGSPEALSVEVVRGEDGLHRLEARVAGRPLPLPLLTVTPEDARLNGLDNAVLAARWQGILQRHLRLARELLQPRQLLRRWVHVLGAEGVLLALFALGLWLWQQTRLTAGRLEDRLGPGEMGWRQSLAIQLVHGLSLGLLLALSTLLLAMVGVAFFAVPGRVPTALDLLLQPFGIAAKLLLVWFLALAAQAVMGLWLRQWGSG